MSKILCYILITIMFTSCNSFVVNRFVEAEGFSFGTKPQQSVVLHMINDYYQKLNCKTLDLVIIQKVSIPKGSVGDRKWREQWYAHGCGRNVKFTVEFGEYTEESFYIDIKSIIDGQK